MTNLTESTQVQTITREIDRLIAEMMALRQQVLNLEKADAPAGESISTRPYFGIWAVREDFQGGTSRDWLDEQRNRQWQRR